MSIQELAMKQIFQKFTNDGKKLLPEPLTRKCREIHEKIKLSCGAELDTTVYLPVYQKQEKWPVILVRNPYYANNMLLRIVYRPLVEQGYALVLVTVRGALDSTGDWLPFEHEREDGRQVVDWIAEQTWCDGNIGTMGGSYLGHTQWSIADYDHPALKAMCILMYGTSGYDLFWRRGMFRQEVWTPWAGQMMEENRFGKVKPKDSDKEMWEFSPQEKLGEHLVGKKCGWYLDWIKNSRETDFYWSEGFWGEFEQGGKNARVPMLMQGGWFDIFQRSQFRAFRQLPEEIRKQSRFVVGPWDHGDPVFATVTGKAHYPEESVTGLMFTAAAVEWFDHMLKGKPYPHEKGTLTAYCIGENKWHTWRGDIPREQTLKLFLNQDISRDNPKGRSLSSEAATAVGQVEYRYDPADPVPMIGMPCISGDAATPGLGENKLFQPEPGFREDVVTFISEPFPEAVTIAGAIKAVLYVASDAKATAFTVNVMEMRADGNSDSIREDISDIRWRDEKNVYDYTPGEVVRLELVMKDVVYQLKKESRIRVDISSSCFPLYHVHPNTDEDWYVEGDMKTANQKIFCGGENNSGIEIPVLTKL